MNHADRDGTALSWTQRYYGNKLGTIINTLCVTLLRICISRQREFLMYTLYKENSGVITFIIFFFLKWIFHAPSPSHFYVLQIITVNLSYKCRIKFLEFRSPFFDLPSSAPKKFHVWTVEGKFIVNSFTELCIS